MRILRPSTIKEACSILAEHGENARVIAGGTVIVTLIKQGILAPDFLVDIRGIPELMKLEYSRAAASIGAGVTHREAEQWDGIRQHYPVLEAALRRVGNIRIKAVGTVGGNLTYGEPQCNLPTVLAALNSSLTLSDGSEERVVPVLYFIKGIFETDLRPGELLKEIQIPAMPPRSDCEFIKFCSRSAEDKPTATVACWLQSEEGEFRCKAARLIVGAVGSSLFECVAAEKLLLESRLDDETGLLQVGEKVKEEIDPIDDLYGSAAYKREVCGALMVKCIREVRERLKRSGYGVAHG